MTIKQITSVEATCNNEMAGADKQRQSSPRGQGRPFKKGNRYAWAKGQSGNPLGRPKTITLSTAYRRALAQIDESDPERRSFAEVIAARQVRVAAGYTSEHSGSAAKELCDRTEGKVKKGFDFDYKVEGREMLALFLGVAVEDLPHTLE